MQAWEAKNNERTKRAAGLGLMAVSLAACGGSDDDSSGGGTDPVVVTPVSAALTIGIDTVTGTTANDTISGARIDTVQTLNTGDIIDGGAGVDSLSATITGGLATSSISNVETITITDLATGGAAIVFSTADDTYISGVTTVNIISSAGATVLTRLVGNATLNFNNIVDDIDATFADSVLSGTADTVTLGFNGVVLAAGENVRVGSVTDVVGDYETLVINASGAASDLGDGGGLGADATTVTVNASAAIDLGSNASFAAVTSFNASASTAGVSAVFANKAAAGTTAVSITGGAGADSFDISALTAANHGAVTVNTGAGNDTVVLGAQGASDYTIIGGAGTDSISISIAADAAVHLGISAFERLTSTGAGVTQNMLLFTGNSTFTTLRAAEDVDFTNVGAVTDLELTTGLAAGDTVQVDRLVDGTADRLSVSTIAAITLSTLDVADEETVTVNASAGALTVDTGVTATDLTSLTVSGSGTVDLSTVTGAAVATVDLSGLSNAAGFIGDFTSAAAMTVTSNTAASGYTGTIAITTGSGADSVTGTANNDAITTGAGNDTINSGAGVDTIDAGTGNDVVNAGAGDDEITGGAGVDTLTGGAGADDFNFADGAAGITVATADVITDFSTADNDELDIAGFAAADLDIVDGGAFADFDALIVAVNAAWAGGAAAGDQIYAAYNAAGTGNAYVFVDSNDNDTFGAGDQLIILTGVNLVTELVAGDFI